MNQLTKHKKELAAMSQQQIDTIVKAIADAGYGAREKLAKMAHEETGFGIWQDKVIIKRLRFQARLQLHQRYENHWYVKRR
ncbi:hypothetical protein AP065_02240 [Listeria monocytogenes]|nr:hypothetical protein AP065_02240 [Listeria monocytogenes]